MPAGPDDAPFLLKVRWLLEAQPREPRGRGRAAAASEVETSDIKKMLMAAATELGFTEQPTEAQPASKPFSFSIIENTGTLDKTGVQDSPAPAAKPTDFDGLKEYLRQNPDKAELVMNSLDVSAMGLDRG